MKRRWPRWLPPKEMAVRNEKAAKWANGMPGGSENPLGAHAMYIYANDPGSIGKAISSGCMRLLKQHIADF